jgi:VanZ family protein
VIDEHPNTAQPTAPPRRSIVPLRWAINAGYAILLVVMAVVPRPSSVVVSLGPDWLAHGSAYGIQAGLLIWALSPVLGGAGALVAGILGAGLFGAATEALQFLQPERSVELRDVVANGAGAIVVGLAIALVRRTGSGRSR